MDKSPILIVLSAMIVGCGGGGSTSGGTTGGTRSATALSSPPGATSSGFPNAVSHTGTSVGSCQVSIPGFVGTVAVRWSSPTTSALVLPPNASAIDSALVAISPNGNYAVGRFTLSAGPGNPTTVHGMLRLPDSTVVEIPWPAGMMLERFDPLYVSDLGLVRGTLQSGGIESWFSYSTTLGYTFLANPFDSLPLQTPAGATSIYPRRLSENGAFVAGQATFQSGLGTFVEAVLWDAATGIPTRLGVLATNANAHSEAWVPSNDGKTIVCYARENDGSYSYCLWMPTTGLARVRDILATLGIAWATASTTVTGLGPDGQYVVGTIPGGNRCYRLKLF